MIVVLPDTLFGPLLEPRQPQPSSLKLIKNLQQGPNCSSLPAYAVDVQDSALLHVAALILPDVKGQRIFAASTPWNSRSLARVLQDICPDLVTADNVPDVGVDLTVFTEAARSEELLRRMGQDGWTAMQVSVEKSCEVLR